MYPYLLILILSSITLSSSAQIILKIGMNNPSVQQSILSGSKLLIIQTICTNLYVLGGLILYFSSAVVWLFVLAKVEVSYAYPFVGLGFIITLLLAHFFAGEVFSTTKVVGTLLIALGVAIVAKG